MIESIIRHLNRVIFLLFGFRLSKSHRIILSEVPFNFGEILLTALSLKYNRSLTVVYISNNLDYVDPIINYYNNKFHFKLLRISISLSNKTRSNKFFNLACLNSNNKEDGIKILYGSEEKLNHQDDLLLHQDLFAFLKSRHIDLLFIDHKYLNKCDLKYFFDNKLLPYLIFVKTRGLDLNILRKLYFMLLDQSYRFIRYDDYLYAMKEDSI